MTTWLKDCCVGFIEDWPANSDLNPIENLWYIIRRKLCDHDTSPLPRLEAELRRVWTEIRVYFTEFDTVSHHVHTSA